MLKGWTPFQRKGLPPWPSDDEIAKQAKMARVSFDEMKKVLEDIYNDTIYVNSRYQVNARLLSDGQIWSLSIKRIDKQRVGPERYRDFLRIKNELVGPEHEGFEVLPAMSRNVDTANQYYVWVFEDPTFRLPVGFNEQRMSVPLDGEMSVNAEFERGDLVQSLASLVRDGDMQMTRNEFLLAMKERIEHELKGSRPVDRIYNPNSQRRDAHGNIIPWDQEHDYFMGFDPDNPDVPTD